MIRINKRKVGSLAIVVVDNEIYNRQVTDQEWSDICDLTKLIEQYPHDNELIDDLKDLLDPIARAKKLEEEARAIREREEAYQKSFEISKRVKRASRIADISNLFEYDEEGFTYLKGFNWKLPAEVCDILLDAKYNPNSKYTIDSIVMFLKQLVLCPNKNVRDNAFEYIKKNGIFITKGGNLLTFRRVRSNDRTDSLNDFIESSRAKIKIWKKSLSNYDVIKTDEHGEAGSEDVGTYNLVKAGTTGHWETIGNLADLVKDKNSKSRESKRYYADYSTPGRYFIDGEEKYGRVEYFIGKETRLSREDCDESSATCSRGLHSWAKSEHSSYTSFGDTILAVLINPMDFISCPYSDRSKLRSAAILPIAELTVEELDTFDEKSVGTIDLDYSTYNAERINELFESAELEELQREGLVSEDITAEEADRVLVDIKALIKSRVVKL